MGFTIHVSHSLNPLARGASGSTGSQLVRYGILPASAGSLLPCRGVVSTRVCNRVGLWIRVVVVNIRNRSRVACHSEEDRSQRPVTTSWQWRRHTSGRCARPRCRIGLMQSWQRSDTSTKSPVPASTTSVDWNQFDGLLDQKQQPLSSPRSCWADWTTVMQFLPVCRKSLLCQMFFLNEPFPSLDY